MNNKIKILIVLIILGIGGGAIGYYMYNKPHENIENKKATYTLSTDDLMAEFETTEEEAKEKYKDKLLQVNGTVQGINKSDDGGITILFASSGTSMGNVKAGLQKESAGKAADLKSGDEVTIKGRLNGVNKMDEMGIEMIDIELSRCVVVE
ncbi:MAG: hypothetical protein WD048_05305 [Chitinophagales bacterium]